MRDSSRRQFAIDDQCFEKLCHFRHSALCIDDGIPGSYSNKPEMQIVEEFGIEDREADCLQEIEEKEFSTHDVKREQFGGEDQDRTEKADRICWKVSCQRLTELRVTQLLRVRKPLTQDRGRQSCVDIGLTISKKRQKSPCEQG
jgi:hypothetical protein